MKNLLTEPFAIRGLALILGLFVILHLLILFGFIPFQMVWGGRLTDHNQMLTFETVSVIINLVMLTVVGIKADYLKVGIKPIVINIALWVMFGVFTLNTIGNILSHNMIEKLVFTPLTLILAIFCFRLATNKRIKHRRDN